MGPRDATGQQLELFKPRLDGPLPMAGGCNWVGFQVLSNPSHSVNLHWNFFRGSQVLYIPERNFEVMKCLLTVDITPDIFILFYFFFVCMCVCFIIVAFRRVE